MSGQLQPAPAGASRAAGPAGASGRRTARATLAGLVRARRLRRRTARGDPGQRHRRSHRRRSRGLLGRRSRRVGTARDDPRHPGRGHDPHRGGGAVRLVQAEDRGRGTSVCAGRASGPRSAGPCSGWWSSTSSRAPTRRWSAPSRSRPSPRTWGSGRAPPISSSGAFLVVVIAPIAEEVFFRGFFYRALRTSLPIWLAVLIDGAVFGVIHYTGPDSLTILPGARRARRDLLPDLRADRIALHRRSASTRSTTRWRSARRPGARRPGSSGSRWGWRWWPRASWSRASRGGPRPRLADPSTPRPEADAGRAVP